MNPPEIGRRFPAHTKQPCAPALLLAGVTAVSMCLLMAVAALAQAAPYYGWTAPPEFQSLTNPIPASAASVGVGQRIFQGRCAPCHGTRGNGEGESADSLRVPPGDLTDKKRMQGYSDGTLFWKIHVGRGEMPPWQLILTEEQIWHVINYIRGFTAKTQ